MRITIENREEPTLIGRRAFFVDVDVVFSEMEKAVIRERQMGKHFIRVGGELPRGKGLPEYGLRSSILRVTSRIGIIGTVITLILHVPDIVRAEWIVFFILLAVVPFAYTKYAEHQFDTSMELRSIELSYLVHNPKFTVYAEDALEAKQAEAQIVGQLNELKQRLLAVAPGLAAKQVYKL